MSRATDDRAAVRERHVAVQAERHWWSNRLIMLANQWRRDAAEEQRVSFAADAVDALIAERNS